jgi:hypothetical protein
MAGGVIQNFLDKFSQANLGSVLRYQLRPVLKRFDLYFERFGRHTFRRTHLTVMSEEGATAFETRDQAGPATVETTMAYVKRSL